MPLSRASSSAQSCGRTGPWRERSARHQRVVRLEQGGHSLQPASLVIHELSFGIQRMADGRRKERFRSYLQNLRRLRGCSYATASLRHAPPLNTRPRT